MEYVSWVKNITEEDLDRVIRRYLNFSLNEAFSERFAKEFPIPISHKILLVAEFKDAGTERIVRYLFDMHVPINVATVQHFETVDGREIPAQVYLVEPEEAAVIADSGIKRRTHALFSEIQATANENSVGTL